MPSTTAMVPAPTRARRTLEGEWLMGNSLALWSAWPAGLLRKGRKRVGLRGHAESVPLISDCITSPCTAPMNSTVAAGTSRPGLGHRGRAGLQQPGEQLPVALHQLLHLVFEGKGARAAVPGRPGVARRGAPGRRQRAPRTLRAAPAAHRLAPHGVRRRPAGAAAGRPTQSSTASQMASLLSKCLNTPLGDANGLCQRGRGDFGGAVLCG